MLEEILGPVGCFRVQKALLRLSFLGLKSYCSRYVTGTLALVEPRPAHKALAATVARLLDAEKN